MADEVIQTAPGDAQRNGEGERLVAPSLPAPAARGAGPALPRYHADFVTGFPDKTRRSFGMVLPKETGSLAQILTVLTATLFLVPGALAPAAILLGELALFFAHEPFMIVNNLRGPRARFESSERAWRQLWVAPLLGVAALAVGVGLGPKGALLSLGVPGVFIVALAPFVIGRLEKTFEGELLATLTIAAFSFPVAFAGGLSLAKAAAVASVWATALCVATMAIRRVTARAKSSMTLLKFVAPLIVALLAEGLLFLLARAGVFPRALPWAPLPVLLFATYIVLRPPHLRHIRKVGWGFAASLLLTSVQLFSAIRG